MQHRKKAKEVVAVSVKQRRELWWIVLTIFIILCWSLVWFWWMKQRCAKNELLLFEELANYNSHLISHFHTKCKIIVIVAHTALLSKMMPRGPTTLFVVVLLVVVAFITHCANGAVSEQWASRTIYQVYNIINSNKIMMMISDFKYSDHHKAPSTNN